MDGVGYLFLVTGGKVAVFKEKKDRRFLEVSEDKDNGGLLKLYNLNNGQLTWSLTSEWMKGMTEVSVGGKLCLAISSRYICLVKLDISIETRTFLAAFGELKGMTGVSVGGMLCTAISFWYNFCQVKIKYRNNNVYLKFFDIDLIRNIILTVTKNVSSFATWRT